MSQLARRTAVALGVVAVLLVGATAFVANNRIQQQTAIQQRVQQELPVGSSYESIEKYLAERHVGYGFVERENRFYVLLPDAESNLLFTASVQMVLTLDSQRRLEQVDVKTLYSGP
jgi:hypothetical protein